MTLTRRATVTPSTSSDRRPAAPALAESRSPEASSRLRFGKGRPRPIAVLVYVVMAVVVASTATQAWFAFVVVPQQIRNSEPVVINQACLLSDGPFVGCFSFLTGAGTVAHQGQGFVLSWNIIAPLNVSGTCTVQSIDRVVTSSDAIQVVNASTNLPVTVLPGQMGVIQVGFAPVNFPFWGTGTVVVTETNP